ncbi:hypothetical protein NE553_14055, partial [Eggerthella lenta]|nr:hypothetical protein [Eggerthella lenta]
RSVSPGVGGNGENALARLGKLRWRNRLMCDGEIGCFYSSANKPAAEEDVKGPAPKPAAALASALRALRRYESKAENPPSGLDRQVLEKISRTASRLLGRI